MLKVKYLKIVTIFCNAIMIIMNVYTIIQRCIYEECILPKLFTDDSNIILLLSSIFYVILISINCKNYVILHILSILRYIATVFLIITLIIVISVLGPVQGGWNNLLFSYRIIFFHLICPIISCISFFFEDNSKLIFFDTFIPLIVLIIYGIVSIIMNLCDVYVGPYIFLEVKNQEWYLTVIYLSLISVGCYGLSFVLLFLINKVGIKYDNNVKYPVNSQSEGKVNFIDLEEERVTIDSILESSQTA